MPDNEECEDCGEIHGPFSMFLDHIHDVVSGGRLVGDDNVRLKVGDAEIPVTMVGIAYDDTVVSFFAIALNDELYDLLEIPERICETCVDEEASRILAGLNLDDELNNLNPHPHDDHGETLD